jgi:hypothetical protein
MVCRVIRVGTGYILILIYPSPREPNIFIYNRIRASTFPTVFSNLKQCNPTTWEVMPSTINTLSYIYWTDLTIGGIIVAN